MKSQSGTRLVALQHRDFRLLWNGRLLSTTGSQMQNIAVSRHIFALLRDRSLTLSLWGQQVEVSVGALG